MFDGILTRLTNSIADAVARGIEAGFRRGMANVLGPLAVEAPAIEDHADADDKPEPASNGRHKARAK